MPVAKLLKQSTRAQYLGWICNPRTGLWTVVVEGSSIPACARELSLWVKANRPKLRDNLDECITQGSYPRTVDRSTL